MNGLECLHPHDVDTVCQTAGQNVLVGSITSDKTNEEISSATDHVTFACFGPGTDLRLKCLQNTSLLAIKTDEGIKIERPAKQGCVNFCMIPFDDAKFFQTPDTPQTGGAEIPARLASSTLVIRPSA